MLRQRPNIGPPAQTPHQQARIKVLGVEPIARIGRPPLTEGVHDRTKGVTRRCEPIFMAGSFCALPSFDNPVVLEFPQPLNENGA